MGVKTLKEEEAQGKGLEKKLPYPKSVFFIATNEFCERFCYYGMRTVLSIYLTDYLLYNESDATVIYHTFIMLAYFFPVFGAMVSDGFLGKYKTMVYISMVYAIGSITLSLAAITPLGLPHREFSLLGLFLIAAGTGGIKPSVLPLGGDQFIMPQQEKLLSQFFSIFYFSVNLGSLVSTIITPILREDVHCFEDDSCFPLAFGLPAVLMIIAIVIIILAKPFIRIIPPEGSLLYKVAACMYHSIKMRLKSSSEKVAHWLDHSKEKYGEKLVEDIKRSANALCMFIPMPIFWALVDQVGSTWTFQARRMNGDIGFYTILPDQMQFANPLLYLTWIPVSEYLLYPAFHRMKILRTTLQKITCGGVITALAFVCSGCVSLALEATYPVVPAAGNGQIRIYNTLPCSIDISTNLASSGSIFLTSGDYYQNIDVELSGNKTFAYSLQSDCANYSGNFGVYEKNAVGYYFDGSGAKFFEDDVSKHLKGLPQVRTLVYSTGQLYNVTYKDSKGDQELVTNSSDYALHSINPDTYQITIGDYEYEHKFYLGGVYAVLAIPTSNNRTTFEAFVIEVTAPNSIHMLWIIPQYVFLTLGEMMFSVPGVEFAYAQAPVSMKSVVMSCWLLTTAVGNLIVIVIEAVAVFELASYNAFLYAGMMLVAMVIFALMAMRYKYVEIEKSVEAKEAKDVTQSS